MTSPHDLNPQQARATEHREGPLLIVAGAGAGKTKTIVSRIIKLIESGVAPEKILAITFTNKAAKEMRERVLTALAERQEWQVGPTPFVSTFHALGAMIIKENAKQFGLTRYFTILDKDESLAIVKNMMKEQGIELKSVEPRRILGIISREKGAGTTLAQYKDRGRAQTSYLGKLALTIWEHYENTLAKRQALDFDDLLLKATELFRRQPDILAQYQDRWHYLHIDEYQDTNLIQYELAQLLAAKRRNICVVGDVDQSIYSWRGADYRNLLRFEEDYPDVTVITLEQNYRSTKNILAAANEIISKNQKRHEKNLFTTNKDGERLTIIIGLDEGEEAHLIGETAKKLIGDGVKPDEIAVLYRTNFQSRVLEEAFLRQNLPYRVLGTRFFDRKEVRDVLAYIKAALNPEDVESVKRIINVPPRGIGKVTLAKMVTKQTSALPRATLSKVSEFQKMLAVIAESATKLRPSQLIKFVISHSGIEAMFQNSRTEEDLERLANVKELASLAVKYDGLEDGLWQLLTEAALVSDQDSLNDPQKSQSGISLMTVHAAKGLEFPYVFIAGLEQNLFPSAPRENDANRDDEEERRLFYVALTRAQEKLFLSYAQIRTIFGSQQVNTPSEFLTDISEELLDRPKQSYLDQSFIDF